MTQFLWVAVLGEGQSRNCKMIVEDIPEAGQHCLRILVKIFVLSAAMMHRPQPQFPHCCLCPCKRRKNYRHIPSALLRPDPMTRCPLAKAAATQGCQRSLENTW